MLICHILMTAFHFITSDDLNVDCEPHDYLLALWHNYFEPI